MKLRFDSSSHHRTKEEETGSGRFLSVRLAGPICLLVT
jgi:hypothetical protein